MAAPQSSSHSPHISFIFFGSLVLSPHLASIVSSPFVSLVACALIVSRHLCSIMSRRASPCISFNNYYLAPVLNTVSLSRCSCSPLSLASYLWLLFRVCRTFTSRLSSHVILLFQRKLFFICIQSF